MSVCPEEKRFDYYKVIAPPEGFQDVYVYVSTNREVVRVSAEAQCRPGETAEGLKEKWLERFRDAMAPDGQNLLTIYACPPGTTNEPAIVYLDLRNAAAESVRMRKGYTKPSFQSRPVFSRTKRKRILHLLLDITNGKKFKKIKIPPCATIREYAILRPSLSREEVSDMVSGPRHTGRDEKSELGPATGHGDRR